MQTAQSEGIDGQGVNDPPTTPPTRQGCRPPTVSDLVQFRQFPLPLSFALMRFVTKSNVESKSAISKVLV